jgi:hypothetical protein
MEKRGKRVRVKSLERRRVGEVWMLKRRHSETIGKKGGDFWILE